MNVNINKVQKNICLRDRKLCETVASCVILIYVSLFTIIDVKLKTMY